MANNISVDPENNSNAGRSKFKYDDVDLSELSKDELIALGIDVPEDEEEEEEDTEDQEDIEDESDEDEGSDQDEDEDDEDEEPELKKKEPRIPKSRFDEAVSKERERAIRAEERSKYLEERIEYLIKLQEKVAEEPKEVEPKFDFDKAEEDYAGLLIEGEIKEAAKLRAKINAEKDKWIQTLITDIKKQAKEEATSTTKTLTENQKKQLVVEEAISKYSFLDSESDDFDEELVDEINSVAYGYEVKHKLSPADALKKALARFVKDEEKPKESKQKLDERKKEKVEKMKKQPPTQGTSTGKIKDKKAVDFDWENMSQTEFRKLYRKNPSLVQEAMRKNYAE